MSITWFSRVLLFLENLLSFPGTQLSVHLIARNYCRKSSGNLLRLSRKNLLTDVSKKVCINCILKVDGSSAGISEIILVIQLLERIIESFDTRSFVKNFEFAARFKNFLPPCTEILFDVDRIGEEGDEAYHFDDESPSASHGEKWEKIHSSSVPRSTSDSDPTQEAVPESAESESRSPPPTRNGSELQERCCRGPVLSLAYSLILIGSSM